MCCSPRGDNESDTTELSQTGGAGGKEPASQCKRQKRSGLGRSPGGGNLSPLLYPCLENPMDRRAWQAVVHGVSKSQTRLKRLLTC